jgi:hypothetical protein
MRREANGIIGGRTDSGCNDGVYRDLWVGLRGQTGIVELADGTIWRTRILPNTRTVFGLIGGIVPGRPAGKDAVRRAAVADLAQ